MKKKQVKLTGDFMKTIKIGIFGMGRGGTFIDNIINFIWQCEKFSVNSIFL